MATHPTLTLADQLVAQIDAAWTHAEPDKAERVYEAPINEETAADLLGRRVWVIPIGWREEPVSRVKNKWMHHFVILTVEKFPETQSGLPDLEWADERAEFVLGLKGDLDYPKDGAVLRFTNTDSDTLSRTPQRSVWTENFEEVEVYDPEMLRDHGLFWSTIDVFYGEVL